MKKLVTLVALASTTIATCFAQPKAPESTPQIEAKVEKILKGMTLNQKIGQMTQLTLDVLTKGDLFTTTFPMELDPTMMEEVLVKYQVGSILNTPSNTPLTTEQWYQTIKTLQEKAIANGGIPLVYGLDQIHGTTYTIGGTLFPQEVGMGATFNPELVEKGSEITAYETRASSVPWNFSPVIDLGRDARWPRQWETYGEDSYLVTVMGRASVEGYQGDNSNKVGSENVAACLKHFMGYGAPASGKDRTPSFISEQDMRERHFAPFLETIRDGALSVMVNSAMNNGMPFHINHEYLTQWLKEDLQWDGVIVTDWADINNVHTRDKVTATKKEAIKLAINAGIDMSMVPYELSFCDMLRELVEEGEVPMSRIDDAVRRVLRMKIRLGLFETPYTNPKNYPLFGSDEFAQVALESAQESITLLKNKDNILPLSAKGKKILVTGPNANSMRTLNGGWTLSWQGEKTDQYAADYNTILESFQNEFGAENVVYEPGVEYNFAGQWSDEKEPQIARAVQAAKDVDYIFLVVGENSYCETPGNLNTLALSTNQQNLAKALTATGKPVILVLNEGRPRVIADIEAGMQAVVQIYLPGNYGGDALVDVITGEVNPSGKLPYTYPRYENTITTYDYKPSQSLDQMQGAYNYDAVMSVQWAFGHGLSYTSFEYSNLKVSASQFDADDTLTFTVDVRNTGERAGKESVMLFSSDLYASLTPDVRRLRSFEKVSLKAGETKTVELTISAKDLAFVGYNEKWVLEKGDFMMQIGNQTATITCTETHQWETPNM